MAVFQSNRSSCGPASLHNALAAIGVHRSEDELGKLAGQTPNGTSQGGLMKAIKHINPNWGQAVKWKHEGPAYTGLWYEVSQKGRPAILCVDNFDHWVACVGHLGERFIIIDSADNRLVLTYNPPELLARWEGPSGGFYAVVL